MTFRGGRQLIGVFQGTLRRLCQRLANVLNRGQADADLDRELTAHLALLEDEYRRRGVTGLHARRAARLAIGGVEQTKELHRDARSFLWLDDARRDVSYALRALGRNPGFTMAAVLTLAIGIGGVTAVFSLVDAVLLRPLPFRDAERLVLVWEDNTAAGFPRDDVAPIRYAAWAAHGDPMESIAAVAHHSVTLKGDGEPEKIEARRVTHSFFHVLGAGPMLGRVFTPDEDRPGGRLVAVLSHRLWLRRFGGDPAIVGRDIVLNDEPYAVVGVMPADFQFLESYVGLWVPSAFTAEALSRTSRYLTVVARLKPGVAPVQAKPTLDTIAARAGAGRQAQPRPPLVSVVTLSEHVKGESRRPLLLLVAAVGTVLLIACANLASLMLARAASRRHEITLRAALGASRGRMVRQLLTESLVLSVLGLLLGLVLAYWTLPFLAQLVPPGMIFFAPLTLDARSLGITIAVSGLTAVLCGLAPAFRITRLDAGDVLRAGGRRASDEQRGRSVLVIGEFAMTLVLLVAAGLVLQTLYRLRYADIGLRPDGVLTLRTVLPSHKYWKPELRVAFYDDVLDRVARLPGVVSAGYTTSVPLEWKGGTTAFLVEGQVPNPDVTYDANHRQVSTNYLSTIGIPLRQGRYFGAEDNARGQPVAMVNATMARQYWPGLDVVGRRFKLSGAGASGPWLTVVGVVGDVRQMGLAAPVKAEMYLPYRQYSRQPWFAPRDLVVRTVAEPLTLAAAIAHEIHAVDPAQPVSNVRTMNAVLDEDVEARRVTTLLLIAFAVLALLLAGIGIYGVISYFVVQHIPEMGIRIAMGAQGRDILMFVVGRGLKLALVGVGAGAVAALAAARLMSTSFDGAIDPVTVALSALLLVVLALVASYVPARRALRLDPIVALRSE